MATRSPTARTTPARSGRDTAAELEFLTRALKAPALRDSVPRLADRAPGGVLDP
jgi:hypothetical protein